MVLTSAMHTRVLRKYDSVKLCTSCLFYDIKLSTTQLPNIEVICTAHIPPLHIEHINSRKRIFVATKVQEFAARASVCLSLGRDARGYGHTRPVLSTTTTNRRGKCHGCFYICMGNIYIIYIYTYIILDDR